MDVLLNLLGQVYEVEVSGGLPGWLFAIFFLFAIAYYVFQAYWTMVIAQRMNMDYPWLAWIPIANYYLIWKMSGKDTTWLILLFVTMFLCGPIGLVFLAIVWMDIAESIGYENWWGILAVIPIIQLFALWKMAYER